MKFTIDLHVHSKFSGDNYSEPEESVLHAIDQKLYGMAFTEHYSYEASEFAEQLREKYGHRIKIFRGVEFSSAEGHCLIFGVNTDRLSIKHTPIENLIRVVTMAGGVVIPSHPYRRVNSLGDLIYELKGICAIEGYNGCNMDAYNRMALKSAKELQLPYTGGSDAHAPEEVGACFTEFSSEVTCDNFIEQLKAGNYTGVDTRKVSMVNMDFMQKTEWSGK